MLVYTRAARSYYLAHPPSHTRGRAMPDANHEANDAAHRRAMPAAPVILSPATPLTPRQQRELKFRRSLRKFWVAGAVGAFFSALSHNIPADVMNFGKPSAL